MTQPDPDADKLEAWEEGKRMRARWAAEEWAAEKREKEKCKLSRELCGYSLPCPHKHLTPLPKAQLVRRRGDYSARLKHWFCQEIPLEDPGSTLVASVVVTAGCFLGWLLVGLVRTF